MGKINGGVAFVDGDLGLILQKASTIGLGGNRHKFISFFIFPREATLKTSQAHLSTLLVSGEIMSKDYSFDVEQVRNDMAGAYQWARDDCGGSRKPASPQEAVDYAVRHVASSNWIIARLVRHEKHRRLGGNANEWLDRLNRIKSEIIASAPIRRGLEGMAE